MILVQLESPFAGKDAEDRAFKKAYLQECILDCLQRGEAPFASHQMYTEALDDTVLEQRTQGIEAGFVWASVAQKRVVYLDLGCSSGMNAGIDHALQIGQAISYRFIWPAERRFPHASVLIGGSMFSVEELSRCVSGDEALALCFENAL